VHPSRKQLNKPIENLSRDRNIESADIGSHLVRKKTINQFHERPQKVDKDDTLRLDDVVSQTKNPELSYNDIYKQMSAPKDANNRYENKIDSDKKREQLSIKNRFPFSENYSSGDNYDNNGLDGTQDYYNDYYDGEYTDYFEANLSANRKNLPTELLSNSANDNIYRKQLLKRFGEDSGDQTSDWAMSHPKTEEELSDRMKYDPYYAQYYYSKYRPQEEGRDVEDEGEDYVSKKIRNVRDNNSIFRQGGDDVGSFIQTAVTVFSLVSNLFGGGSGGGSPLDLIGSLIGGGGGSSGSSSSSSNSKVDRIDTAGVDDAISTINQASGTGVPDDLDVAMGTLMAYSGKFLRQIGLWAFEHATQTSSDTFSESAVPDKDTVAAVLGGGISNKVGIVASSTGYLSTLTQPELEKLGLKAVSAGAKPGKLQEAFVTAQTNGDWSKLESLISGALGADAIRDPSAGNPIAGISNFVSNFIGGGPSPTKIGNNPVASSSDGPSYSQVVQNTGGATSEANGILDKLSVVWNGDPNADPVTQGSIATRFVTTFGLQQEALSLQSGVNSVLKTINGFLGEESSYSSSSGNTVSNCCLNRSMLHSIGLLSILLIFEREVF